jgi:hypothetical protein
LQPVLESAARTQELCVAVSSRSETIKVVLTNSASWECCVSCLTEYFRGHSSDKNNVW